MGCVLPQIVMSHAFAGATHLGVGLNTAAAPALIQL